MSSPYSFQLGALQVTVFSDSSRTMDLREAFPGVEAEAFQKVAAGFPSTELAVGYNVLLLDDGRQKTLIDAGGGRGDLPAGLSAAGIAPEAIDRILITHGDGDHIGGLGLFPRARILLPRPAWDLWTTPAGRERMVEEFIALFRERAPADRLVEMAAQRAAYGETILPALQERIELVEGEADLAPGLRFLPAPGHRSDHFAVEIRSDKAQLLHLVDAIRHPHQVVDPGWTSYIDSYPAQTAATNERLFAMAAETRALVFATHLPFPGLGRIDQTPDGRRWQPL